MSVEAPLSTAPTEEVSGWWHSERSAKARFKALLGRTKLEKLTRQNKVEFASIRPNISQSACSGRVAPAPGLADAKESNSNTTPSSPTQCAPQQQARPARRLKVQRSLTSIGPLYSRPLIAERFPDEPEPASPVAPQPAMYRKTSRNVSRSTTDSSVHTLNSVDPPTEPSLSDGHSVYTTHTSFSSYASSSSYAAAEASSAVANSHEAPTPGDRRPEMSTPTPDESGVLCMSMPTPKKNTRPFPSLSLTTMPRPSEDAKCHDLFVQKPLPPLPASWRQRDGNEQRRISTVGPLPEPGHIRKTSARYRCEPFDNNTSRCATPTSPSSTPPCDLRSRSSSYTLDSAEGGRKRAASYSLFPRTPSTGQQRLPINGIPSPPAAQCSLRCPGKPTDAERGDLARPSPPSRRDQRRHGKVLPSGTILVADQTGGSQTSQTSSSGEEVDPPAAVRVATTSWQSILQRQKSMPCLIRPRSPSSGPPPDEPLPALPPEASSCLALPPRSRHER